MSKEPTQEEFDAAMDEHERKQAAQRLAELEKQAEENQTYIDDLTKLIDLRWHELRQCRRDLVLVVRAAIAEALDKPTKP
jgi:ABC-type molybdenum transport system ATPase subunit/photorepair protein PhrA